MGAGPAVALAGGRGLVDGVGIASLLGVPGAAGVVDAHRGVRLVDLFSFNRRRLGRDGLLGLAILLVVFPLTMIPGTMLSTWLLFGSSAAPMYPGELTSRVLPLVVAHWGMDFFGALYTLAW